MSARISDSLFGAWFMGCSLYAAVCYVGSDNTSWMFGSIGWLLVLISHNECVEYRKMLDLLCHAERNPNGSTLG